MDEVKNLKLALPYVTEDGKSTLKEQTVVFKKIIEEESPNYNNNYLVTYKMGMSIVIPSHIHSKLVGATVPRKRNLGDDNGMTYDVKFPKTLNSDSLENLTKRYREIIYDYKWLVDLDQMELKKVIFYNFNGNIKPTTKSYWDGKKLGCSSEIKYGFMIGYVSNDSNKPTRLNEDKKIFQKRDGEESGWKYVEYTETREKFFASIFDKFDSLYKELKRFEENITETGIDKLISSQPKLLSNG